MYVWASKQVTGDDFAMPILDQFACDVICLVKMPVLSRLPLIKVRGLPYWFLFEFVDYMSVIHWKFWRKKKKKL